ncbi:MAG: AAA family ATPase [Proteobacteria bacterium]|nr:AAA family ATPase [Pseudomonadota bacterium]
MTDQKPAALGLPIVTASSFSGRDTPERRFLDGRQMIPAANVTILAGDGGTGKSLLAMQLSIAVAGGTTWLDAAVDHGPVVYFSAEDDEDETHIRIKEITGMDGPTIDRLHNLHIAVMAGQDAVLAAEQPKAPIMCRTAVMDQLEAAVSQILPKLLVLDNLADIFAGNENAKTLARQFIGMLRGLAIRHDIAIVLLVHPSQSGMSSGTGTSGSLGWGNSVRSRLYFYRVIENNGEEVIEADPDARIIEVMKANYRRKGDQVRLRWEAGRFVSLDELHPAAVDRQSAPIRAERVFLDLVRWHASKNIPVSPNRSSTFAPTVFARHPQREGISKRGFENAMHALLENNRIRIETVGPPSKQRSIIEIVPERPRED